MKSFYSSKKLPPQVSDLIMDEFLNMVDIYTLEFNSLSNYYSDVYAIFNKMFVFSTIKLLVSICILEEEYI
jgi:hypothetical protein